jgi:hypothetical protein
MKLAHSHPMRKRGMSRGIPRLRVGLVYSFRLFAGEVSILQPLCCESSTCRHDESCEKQASSQCFGNSAEYN